MKSDFDNFKKKLASPLSFQFFLFTKLPSAFFAGLKIEQLEENVAAISVRYGWFNKNPFRSMYFAVLAMAAEVSTGLLCFSTLYKKKQVSMLLVKNEGFFYKKAVGKIVFTCNDGVRVSDAVQEAIASNEAKTVVCNSKGVNRNNELVAEFNFTWSFKVRN